MVKIANLKIGPESRGSLRLCSVLELHHTIMSKRWDLGDWTKKKKRKKKDKAWNISLTNKIWIDCYLRQYSHPYGSYPKKFFLHPQLKSLFLFFFKYLFVWIIIGPFSCHYLSLFVNLTIDIGIIYNHSFNFIMSL